MSEDQRHRSPQEHPDHFHAFIGVHRCLSVVQTAFQPLISVVLALEPWRLAAFELFQEFSHLSAE